MILEGFLLRIAVIFRLSFPPLYPLLQVYYSGLAVIHLLTSVMKAIYFTRFDTVTFFLLQMEYSHTIHVSKILETVPNEKSYSLPLEFCLFQSTDWEWY